jgi:hypothetical protein
MTCDVRTLAFRAASVSLAALDPEPVARLSRRGTAGIDPAAIVRALGSVAAQQASLTRPQPGNAGWRITRRICVDIARSAILRCASVRAAVCPRVGFATGSRVAFRSAAGHQRENEYAAFSQAASLVGHV